MTKKIQKASISKLKKKLDAEFSKFIRYRDGGQCYTCTNKNHPKKMQNGHFVPRQYLAVRYDERNCHCQCYACNMLYGGQPSVYAIRLKRDFGDGIIEELESLRCKTTKLTPMWYEEQIEKYKELNKDNYE